MVFKVCPHAEKIASREALANESTSSSSGSWAIALFPPCFQCLLSRLNKFEPSRVGRSARLVEVPRGTLCRVEGALGGVAEGC